jgi:hypothetical protein
MRSGYSRREVIQKVTGASLATATLLGLSPGVVRAEQPAGTGPWPGFPRLDPKLVAEVVGMAHRNQARVRELVKLHPPLVNAWWDWGFGDWESPLGAASHVGQRGIAEFLVEQGARIDIFAAAMLGMTDVVKAFVTAQPGVQRNLGPHGIPLLAHAKVGGKRAADTVAYLESLGDAGTGLKFSALPADRKDAFLGKYASDEAGVRLEFRVNNSGRLVVDTQAGKVEATGQNLYYVGDDEFFPSGVPSVRFQFAVEGGKARSVTIRTREPIFTAQRVGG